MMKILELDNLKILFGMIFALLLHSSHICTMIERSIIYIDLDQDINSRAVHNSPRHLHNLGDSNSSRPAKRGPLLTKNMVKFAIFKH